LAVILYHFKTRTVVQGGFFGVDLFFALSGFLITSLLLVEWQTTGKIALPRFYLRRVLRLMPAFLAFVTVYTAFSILYHPVTETGAPTPREALANASWSMTYLYSWAVSFNQVVAGGYMPLWSLSVEEQFYLVWPVLLWLMIGPGKIRPSIVMLLTGALFVLSAGMPFIHHWGHADPDMLRATFGADYRAQGLLAGCMAGIACTTGMVRLEHVKSVPFRLLAFSAAAVLTLAIFETDAHMVRYWHEWGLPLISIAAAITVLGASFIDCGTGRLLLGNRAISYLGARSYAIYLWHYPMSQVFIDLSPPMQLIVAGAASLLAAEASHWLVERPALHLRDRLSKPRREPVVSPEVATPTLIAA
jgi:peptidoglycan/LPS O-acetylase OafA/YrhL